MLRNRVQSCLAVVLLFALFGLAPAQSEQPSSPDHPCEKDPAYHKLDFWLGHWDVVDPQDGTLGGTNYIEKILDGCALVENWHELDPRGADGKSLFYYQKPTHQWKQVWVTAAGPIKEKKMIEEIKDGGVRFQGEIPRPDGTSYLDRTTLTPLPGDRVRQVIEVSRDSGKTWQTTFDAEYRRPK